MSFIGATGLDEVQEQFDILQENIDANASYINNLVGIPDPTHTAIFGINILNPGLFGLVERAEVNIGELQTGEEALTTQIEGIETQIEAIETQITGIEEEIISIEGQISGIQGEISTIQFTELPAIVSSISVVGGVASDALVKSNKSLGIWDEDGNNTYNMKSGNVAIGILPKGTLLNNKLEVNGSINIPTGSKYKINNVDLSYNDLTDKLIGSLEQNIIGLDNNELIINDKPDSSTIGDVFIPLTANNEPILLTAERSYPPIRNFTLGNQTLSGEPYGNGTYIMTWSTTGSGGSPANCFNTANTIAGAWGAGQYNNGLYIGSAFVVADYLGDWLKIQLPVPIILTSIAFIMRASTIALQDRAPRYYKIYGSNDGTNWVELISKVGAVYNTQLIHEETTSQTIAYSHYALVVNKLNTGATSLNFDEWYIYGKEIITAVPEGNPITHKTFSLIHNPITLTHDFTDFNDLTSWNNYAISKGMFNAGITTYDAVLDAINNPTGTSSLNYRLPPHYNFVSVSYGNPSSVNNVVVRINNIDVSSCTPGQFKTHSQSYNKYDILTILEGTSIMSANIIITLSNSSLNTYSLSVQAGTSIQINNQTAQYLSGDYIINVGAIQSSVLGGNNPYPLQNGSSIDVKYSMTQKTTGTINYKKDGFIKYTPVSSEYPTTGNWEILDIDAQPLIQFGGNLPINRIDGNLPANRLDNIDMSKVATGNLDWSRIASKPLLSDLGGTLSYNNLTDKLIGSLEQNIIGLDNNELIVVDKPNSEKIDEVFVPLTNEPYSTPSVVPTTEGNPITYKTLNFAYIAPPLTYDFTSYNSLTTWTSYATSIGATYVLPYYDIDTDAVWNPGSAEGYLTLSLNNNYNYLSVTFGNALINTYNVFLKINGITKETCTGGQTKTYSQSYNNGDILTILEGGTGINANIIITLTNTNYITNTYTLSVPSTGTGVIINNTALQYLSAGNYTISVGATQSSVIKEGIGQVGSDPYPATNGSTISFKYSMTQRIQTITYYKKDGLIKYVPASTEYPTTGNWEILDIDAQPLIQFGGNLPINRIDGNLPANRLDNIDMSKVATGNLDWSRIASKPLLSDLGGTLSYNNLTDKLTAGTNISIVGNAINNTLPFTTIAHDIFTTNLNNFGIGNTLPVQKLDVNGSINIALGSKYKINNIDLSYNDLTNKLTAGDRITIANNVITAEAPYASEQYSGRIPIREYGTGVLNYPANFAFTLDGITIKKSTLQPDVPNNVIYVPQPDWNQDIIGGSGYIYNKPTLFDGNYNSLTNKLTAGTNISIISGAINNTLTAGTNISIVSGAINNTLTAGTNISIVSGAINNTLPITTNVNDIYTTNIGNVGIGTSILNNKLEVNGSVNIPTGSKYKINNLPLSYSDLGGTPPVSSKWTNATDVATNIYYSTGNVGIGVTSAINNKLEVGGSINIPTGSKYKINNVDLSYNDLTNKLTAGTNISIVSGAINNTLTAGTNISIVSGAINNTLTAGTNISIVSGAINNTLTAGTNISIVSGAINNTYTYTLPTAGVGAGGDLGGVKVDGTSITITNGIISSTSTASGADIFLDGSTNNRSYGWTGSTGLLGRVGVAGNYSTGSAVEDVVLRSQGKLILQSGITNPAMVIDTTNNAFFRNAVGIGTSTIAVNNILDIGGVFRVGNNVPLYSFLVSNITGNVGMGTTAQTNSKLHLHKSGASLVKIHFTDGFTGTAETNGLTIYKSSTDEGYFWNYQNKPLIFGTNNLERLRILEGGNVGIGTTSPSSRLHLHNTLSNQNVSLQITDASTLSGGLLLNKSTNNNGYLLNYENADLLFGTNSLERMRITASGNVGIGTTNPTGRLHLHKENATLSESVGLHFTDTLTGRNASDGFYISKGSDNDAYIYNNENNAIKFGTGGVEAVRIEADGNLLVKAYGVINSGTRGIFFRDGFVSTNKYNCSILTFDHSGGGANDGISINGFGGVSICTGSNTRAERMRIGNTGVTIANNLIVSNGIYQRNQYEALLYTDSAGMYLCFNNIGDGTNSAYLKLSASVGHTNYESNQQRSHRFYVYQNVFSGNAYVWQFVYGGGSYNGLNTSVWNTTCDHRIKENIVKADLKNCYDNIKNINLYRYNYIDSYETLSKDKNKLGYIAQEVKKHFPKAIHTEKTRLKDKREIPDLLTIDVEQINLTLYGAVKQLIKIVEKQSKRIKALETLLNIEDNDEVEDDAGQPYERIYDENEIDIDTIEPTEPSNEV